MKNKSIIISFSLSDGSLSDHFIELSNQLSNQFQVIILSDNKYFSKNLNTAIVVKYWPSKRPTKIKDFIFYLKLINNYKPIAIIALFGSVNLSLICSYLFHIKHRIAWIRSLSTQIEHNRLKTIRKSFVYRLATKIITNSRATAKDSSRFYQIKKSKISILKNSVSDYYEDTPKLKLNKNKILYVGRLHQSKGVDVLVKAFALLAKKYSSLKLNIVGSGPEKERLIKISQQKSIQNRVHFKGNKPKKEVLKEMKTSYVSVVPSHSEAFGFTVIEAMSMRTCVIGADNTGIAEIIKPNETGLLFKTANHNDLAEKLDLVLKNPEMRNRLAIQGYKHFKANYSTENAVKRDAVFFVNLIENKK